MAVVRPGRPARAVAALLALTLAAGACGQVGGDAGSGPSPPSGAASSTPPADPADATDPTGPDPTGPSPTGTVAAPDEPSAGATIDLGPARRYVALGDSFSAGGGLTPYDDAACGRSPRAYPQLLEFAGPVDRSVLACEAARVADVAAQARAADLGDDVGLVTLTVGGNDAGFIDFFGACALRSDCFDAPYAGSPTFRAWGQERRARLGGDLVELLAELRERAPNARLVLAGYPQLLPAELSTASGCQLLGAAFDAGELAELRASTTALNEVLSAAAATAGATFAPVEERFAGHEACGPGEPWLLFGGMAQLLRAPDGVLHPNDVGQAAYAEAVAEAVR